MVQSVWPDPDVRNTLQSRTSQGSHVSKLSSPSEIGWFHPDRLSRTVVVHGMAHTLPLHCPGREPNPQRLVVVDQGLILNPGLVLRASMDMSRENSFSAAPPFCQCFPLPSLVGSLEPTLSSPPWLYIVLQTTSQTLQNVGFVNSEMLFSFTLH